MNGTGMHNENEAVAHAQRYRNGERPSAPPPPGPAQPVEEFPEWTKAGVFPPVSRDVPLYGKDPASGKEQVWVGRVVWQARTLKEITVAVYCPFGRKMSTGESVFDALPKIRGEPENVEQHNSPWKVLVKDSGGTCGTSGTRCPSSPARRRSSPSTCSRCWNRTTPRSSASSSTRWRTAWSASAASNRTSAPEALGSSG